jgi:hypothetical protein
MVSPPKILIWYFIDKILPSLISDDTENIIKRATICKDGNLTFSFESLRDYLKGN